MQKNKFLKYKKFFLFFFIFVFFSNVFLVKTFALDNWPKPPELVSKQAILMDADTGAILYEKNAYKRNYPASTTKILTGLLVVQNAALDEKLTFSKKAANSVEFGDATLGMKEGEVITIEEALAALLLHSANEVSYALAEHVSGSLSSFVDKMNEVSKSVGTLDTHFTNASGLFNANHYSTPYDMALIARMCFNNPNFLATDSLSEYTLKKTNKNNEERHFFNRNKLLPDLAYGYEFCVGGKTGYIPEGGYTYVSYAQKNGQRLIAVCFDSTEDDRFFDAKKLFEYGYNNFKRIPIVESDLTMPYEDTSFMYSSRFLTDKIDYNFDASFITLPNTASLKNVTIDKDEKHEPIINANELSLPVDFKYENHIVGTANIKYLNPKDIDDNPIFKNGEEANLYKKNRAVVIDLKITISIAIAIFLTIVIFIKFKKRKNKR